MGVLKTIARSVERLFEDLADFPQPVGGRRGRNGASRTWDRVLLHRTRVTMAANKVRGVRAALCTDAATAVGARRWNDANVLAFGLRLTTVEVATEMIGAFLATAPDADERAAVARLEDPLG